MPWLRNDKLANFARGAGAAIFGLGGALLVSCATTQPPPNSWHGPTTQAGLSAQPWQYPHIGSGCELNTAHYRIYTTVNDSDFDNRAAQVMEGALAQYQALSPTIKLRPAPMECYLFADRSQWAHWTEHLAGINAHIYLLINRGGYTFGDKYVAYCVGGDATWSVASHEGWHQFVAHNSVGRLPPFLEEGLSTMFETIEWDGGLPRWNLLSNPRRANALRNAIESHNCWTLDELVAMHAGNVVGQPGGRIEAFYAQAWAFAQYLYAGEGGKYRPVLDKILADAADGTIADPTGTLRQHEGGWNPAGVKPMLESYLKMPLATFAVGYEKYCQAISIGGPAWQ